MYWSDMDEFEAFLAGWREDLTNALREDPQNYLKVKHPTIASHVSQKFPDPAIVFLYANPVASPPSEPFSFTRKAPDLRRMGSIDRQAFAYQSWSLALEEFECSVFPAVLAEALQQIARDGSFPRFLTGYIVRTQQRGGAIQFLVRTDCRLFVNSLRSGYDERFLPNHRSSKEQSRNMWVHGVLLALSHHQLVVEYYRTKQNPNPFKNDRVCFPLFLLAGLYV